jgi:hypothetical protein
MTWIFSDDFTIGMTEGFKPGSPYTDVTQSPVDSPTEHTHSTDTLFLYFSFFFPFFFPIPTLPLFSTQALKFLILLYVVTTSVL